MAGTFSFNPAGVNSGIVNSLTIPWTSDASGNATVTTDTVRGVILRVVTDPDAGGSAPTDGYDLTIADENGATILSNTDRDTANAESLMPTDSTTGLPFAVAGPLTITIANAGNAKSGVVVIYFR